MPEKKHPTEITKKATEHQAHLPRSEAIMAPKEDSVLHKCTKKQGEHSRKKPAFAGGRAKCHPARGVSPWPVCGDALQA